jgi:LacI family transcriptional regulator
MTGQRPSPAPRPTPHQAITLADVARRAGVSIQTVSRVVNQVGETSQRTRARVLAAVEELGYRPNGIARGLRAKRSRTIAIVVPDITNPFFPEIVRGAEEAAGAAGYAIFLGNVVEDIAREASVLRVFEEQRVDGVIVCSSRQPDDALIAALKRHAAAVVVNRMVPPDVAGVVRVDHARGARLAIEHLLTGGRKRLAFLNGLPESKGAQDRALGVDDAMRVHGLALVHRRSAAPSVDGGDQGTRAMLAEDPAIDGLFCYNDLMAAGALRALAALGRRVPEDVAVIGCDDIQFAAMFNPALTTLRVDKFDIGHFAVRQLLDRIDGRTNQPNLLFQPELVVRASAP